METLALTLNGQQYNANATLNFTSHPAPAIASLSPSSGPTHGATTVTLALSAREAPANHTCRFGYLSAGEGALDYRSFYNDAVNQEVNLKEDYRRWKSQRGEFSFCDNPFVLEPASKSRVLMYDATASKLPRSFVEPSWKLL